LKIPSNMGIAGKPGASLKGWKYFAPNAEVIGADIDRKVLFSENGIRTFYLNQLDRRSFSSLLEAMTDGVDLVIIDGLHTLRADLNSLLEILPYLNNNGILFIEDVGNLSSKFVWPRLLKLLRHNYSWKIHHNLRGNLVQISNRRKQNSK